jgi:hypothetical protein
VSFKTGIILGQTDKDEFCHANPKENDSIYLPTIWPMYNRQLWPDVQWAGSWQPDEQSTYDYSNGTTPINCSMACQSLSTHV